MAPRSTPASRETYRKKLAEEHVKFYERAKERKRGSYTASETGARGLALQRLQYFLREHDRRRRKEAATKLSHEVA